MSGDATIRPLIKTKLDGIESLGRVHDYMRFSRSVAGFLNFFRTGGGTVNGCMFGREAVPSEPRPNPKITRNPRYRMIFLYQMDDAAGSEKTFQALLDAVFDAFRTDPTLGRKVNNSGPLQVEMIENENFGGTLYHYAECTLAVQERVNAF